MEMIRSEKEQYIDKEKPNKYTFNMPSNIYTFLKSVIGFSLEQN